MIHIPLTGLSNSNVMEGAWLMIITALLKCNMAVYYEPITLLLMLNLSSQMVKCFVLSMFFKYINYETEFIKTRPYV